MRISYNSEGANLFVLVKNKLFFPLEQADQQHKYTNIYTVNFRKR